MWFFRKKGPPYTLGDQISFSENPLSIKMFHGIRNSDQKEFSIFEFRPKSNPLEQALTQNAIKSWRTIRHPSIPNFIESYDHEGASYVVTEKLLAFDESKISPKEISYAAYTLIDFVSFMHDANGIHGNLKTDSLFLTNGHELKVGGLQWLTINNDGPINTYHKDWLKSISVTNLDPTTADLFFSGTILSSWQKSLPRKTNKYIQKWKNNNGNLPDPKDFLSLPEWKSDNFVQHLLFLRDLPMKDSFERETFFKKLIDYIPNFSPSMCEYLLLPKLLSSLSYAQEPSIIPLIFSLSKSLKTETFDEIIIPNILPLFENKDRSIRVSLLTQITNILPHLNNKTINDRIFPNVVLGLSDSSNTLKASTIISMVHLAPYLNVTNIRNLIRELKKLHSDNEPSIRCNSIVCLAKIAEYIEPEFRNQTLSQCFTKAALDQFPPARKAAIAAWKTTNKYFDKNDVAKVIIPSISHLCVDSCDDVKILALKLFKQYVDELCDGVNLNVEVKEQKKENVQMKNVVVNDVNDGWDNISSNDDDEEEEERKDVKKNVIHRQHKRNDAHNIEIERINGWDEVDWEEEDDFE
ncbi:N-terminal kinase-like protein [Histomonas meleagridis]|uniref:N-terminal kinase-like protein n=1 Tax=Histomonas meleagridis TaxID=135588 RepID=UPI00355AC8D8|nr:N-terminal kinase-like protein [Histomonas meleagridis]KAH0803257.1 N-terminal kinase-like protein [Histomonas meleagridis]